MHIILRLDYKIDIEILPASYFNKRNDAELT